MAKKNCSDIYIHILQILAIHIEVVKGMVSPLCNSLNFKIKVKHRITIWFKVILLLGIILRGLKYVHIYMHFIVHTIASNAEYFKCSIISMNGQCIMIYPYSRTLHTKKGMKCLLQHGWTRNIMLEWKKPTQKTTYDMIHLYECDSKSKKLSRYKIY